MTQVSVGPPSRPRGRPKLDITSDAIAREVAALFDEGGPEAVSIAGVAERLGVARATLYRTVPSRQHLLAVLFEKSIQGLLDDSRSVTEELADPWAQLAGLVRLHADIAIRMRSYLPVFFDSSSLPPEVAAVWADFVGAFEALWSSVIQHNMDAGYLTPADPMLVTRLITGQFNWVCHWYRYDPSYSSEDIAATAMGLLGGLRGRIPSQRRG
ncbi:TetR/AcrR family transcriptional regulator [Nocardioides marmoriginsengisoli]|uniref:TetR/AcrR family transcriptional regulator n=2 Tax=Nocardioides marmoriginsengisoli TaxID=661483 RepID=A0A3N0CIG5_9ACTN|nr:TetR/AcrR family transcriptional regulator [Nocardioides marmoriginsengisoli]